MNRYDPERHHRQSIRLPGYDYASPGAYFVTLCVQGGECLLGDAVDGQMQWSRPGRIAWARWQALPTHFPVRLDAFVVMPNHLHAIVIITGGGGEASPRADSEDRGAAAGAADQAEEAVAGDASPLHGPSPGSLGAIVGSFKSVTTRQINRLHQTPARRFWQRNYWEHVIRSPGSLQRIRDYIQANPARWAGDQLHPAAAPNPFNRRNP